MYYEKTIICGSFGVAGLLSAKQGITKLIKLPYELTVKVTTTCGAPYQQTLHFYTYPTSDDLQNIATGVNNALCGVNGGTGKVVKDLTIY